MQHRLAFLLAMVAGITGMADEWPRFRGPNGAGLAPALDIPSEWSDSDYAWEVDLPGTGHSSPVVWGEQVFVTTGTATGDLHLDAYDVATGARNWRTTLPCEKYAMHASNSYASATPAVDQRHIYLAYYLAGEVSVLAVDHAGDEQWRTSLGEFASPHGFGASPMVMDDVVCLQGDNTVGGYLVVLDGRTGNECWRTERPAGKESYATPAIIDRPGGKQAIVVTSMTGGIRAVEPASGDLLWQQADALPARTVSSPIVAGNLVLATCGGGGNGKQLTAVRIAADGTAAEAFTLTKNVPYVPTGIVCDDLLFLWHERGTITCIDLATSDPLWTKRIGGKFFGSPICLGNRLLALSIDGQAVMVAATREYKELGRTELGEGTESTPAVADGRLFLRTESKLRCLAE